MNAPSGSGDHHARTVIIGLGNTVLRDDGAGVYAARLLGERLRGSGIDVIEAELAGLDIIEKLRGYERAVIIDTIQLGGERPGTIFRITPEDVPTTPRLASFHDVDLVTALALGRRLGFSMPDEVVIFAVQAEDVLTLGEGCLPAVAAAIPALVEEVAGEATGRPHRTVSRRLCERSGHDA
jgi:hydrogenase maturation protease